VRLPVPAPLQVPAAPAAPGLGTPARTAKTPGANRGADGQQLGADQQQQQLQGEDKSYGTTAYWQEAAPKMEDLAQITSDWWVCGCDLVTLVTGRCVGVT
jgi:hypothetical protein